MAEENPADGNVIEEQGTAASNGHSAVGEDSQNNPQDTSKRKEDGTKTVPYYKLFSFADSLGYLLIGNNKAMFDAVSKVALKFVYLAVGAAAASFLQMSCWMVTGERHASQIRSLYLKTILRQDVGFLDKEINTGEIVGRMSGDTVLIQEAMGEKEVLSSSLQHS
ncbi:hypothetical protein L3X38_001931 [Prunus dulcis]|uniref:ABC transmembrane type-1 domain-containing protein n=1 Tax=Prunus dulcis TaxID=3755 RepID=A0AAD4ZKD2_PRUDU|nr:hypothetical protein L3X38_001931 [Prunus dulcis]